jgi:hypothetical protein
MKPPRNPSQVFLGESFMSGVRPKKNPAPTPQTPTQSTQQKCPGNQWPRALSDSRHQLRDRVGWLSSTNLLDLAAAWCLPVDQTPTPAQLPPQHPHPIPPPAPPLLSSSAAVPLSCYALSSLAPLPLFPSVISAALLPCSLLCSLHFLQHPLPPLLFSSAPSPAK